MIPISLTLQNFMSYGEEPTTLPFEGLHVACLSGDNGNGKSALLDAMTYALWGKTRVTGIGGITDDDLIRLGADEMEVRFEFELSGQRYRAVKKRKRGKSSDWQFAQVNSNGDYASIGGSSRDVGKQIIQTLSMEYDTFINSAYLQQGRADEFTRQRPADRKRILGEILGLERYEKLEAKAKVLMNERKEEAQELDREITLLQREVERLPEHQKALEAACAALAKIEADIQAQEKVAADWRDRRSKLESVAALANDLDAQILRVGAELTQRQREQSEQQARLNKMREILAQRDSVVGDYERMQVARRKREELDPKVERFNRISADLQVVIGAIDIAKTNLNNEIRLQEKDWREVERRKTEALRLEAQMKTLAFALQDEGAIIRETAEAQDAAQAAQDLFSELRSKNERLKQDITDLDEVLALLGQPRAACPICESDLSGNRQAVVIAKQEQKRAVMQQEQERLKREGGAAKTALTEAQNRAKSALARRDEITVQRTQYDQFCARFSEVKTQGIDADAALKRLNELKTQLERGAFAGPEQARRIKLESERELLKLVKAEYEQVVMLLRTLETAEKRFHTYQETAENWDAAEQAGEQIALAVMEKLKERETIAARLRETQAKLSQFDEIRNNAAIAENDLARMQDQRGRLLGDERSNRGYIAKCEAAQVELTTKRSELKIKNEERQTYNALVQAFGKKGIQAHIIESAIPEIEEETNLLLAKMTENQMTVHFETTRAAKTGDSSIETLDIKIRDDAGVRPYELFSGGEGFRVNFAIRIALSRLLARRSGAKLQTLIMDEGFGSQDGKGREKLVEVIESIKDDFEKILIITHFEEMKDSFSQRIEIVKDAQGSRIHLY